MVVDKYIEALTTEQQELISYVKRMTANISVPDSAIVITQPIQPKNHKAASAICLAGGVLAMVAGYCMNNNVITVAGGIAFAGGAGLSVMDSKNSCNASVQREVDYFKVTSHYYKSLSDIYKYVTNHWTGTLAELKGKLKSDIMQIDIPEEKQNKAIQSILTTSVVDMSMSDLSKDLSGIEKSRDENGYNQYVSVFTRKCIESINTAFEEQRAIYGKLREVIME